MAHNEYVPEANMLNPGKTKMFLVINLMLWCIAFSGCLSPEDLEVDSPIGNPAIVTPDTSIHPPTNVIIASIHPTQSISSATLTPPDVSPKPTEEPFATGTTTQSEFNVSGWLIFSDLPFRLAIIQTDGKGSRNILENTEFPERVKVSPDGQWIAFISNTSQLYLVRPDGSELKQLTFSDEVKTSLSWSPNGEAIVYSQTIESEDQFEVELFVYEIHTFQIHQLTDTPGVDEFAPVYSPDGETIAFTSPSFQDETQPLTFRPMLIDVSGGNARPLLDIPTGSVDMLAWSPNGNQIVFTSGEPGLFCDTDLYVVNTDGSDLLRLTDTSDQDIYPTWSPDGQWIAFTRSPCNDAGNSGFDQIFIAHANGLGLRQLTNEKNLTITGLSWFPQPTLQAGATVTITELGADLNLRSSPSLSGPVLAKITEGANILILAGPVEADSYLWWRVRLESGGVEGWVADNPGWFMTDE